MTMTGPAVTRPEPKKRSPQGSPIEYHSDDLDRDFPGELTPGFVIKDDGLKLSMKDGKKSTSVSPHKLQSNVSSE